LTDQNKTESPINNWVELNERLHVFKIISLSLGGITVFLLMFVIYFACRAPLVIAGLGENQIYEIAHRKNVTIDENAIGEFLKNFLHFLYDWKNFNPSDVVKTIGPFATDGLVDKIKVQLTERREKDFKDKVISQGITNLEFNFSKDQVVATFDKVLRVNGIPLVIPAEIAFNLVKKSSTKWNPIGLYVNGMIEHEGSKD
jgi:hypothetical protein